MIFTKTGYEIQRYKVKDFLAEGLHKIKNQIVKVNSEMAIDAHGEIYKEKEQNFMALQLIKLDIAEMLIEVDDNERLSFLYDFLNAYLKDKKSNAKQNHK